jgi:hypothetical protein
MLDNGELQELSELMYADQPDHVRSAGGPWAGVARAVERTLAVLEDGHRKLAEMWRSPAGAAYLAEMSRVVDAMRATSEAARHNDQVMSAAADALDGKQKDFAVLTTAPIPEDARERYARAIVNALDESYQQAVANFRDIPVVAGYDDLERPLFVDQHDQEPSSAGDTDQTSAGQSAQGELSKHLPGWVPFQASDTRPGGSSLVVAGEQTPAAGSGNGPELQGTVGSTPGVTRPEMPVTSSSVWQAGQLPNTDGVQSESAGPFWRPATMYEWKLNGNTPSRSAGSTAPNSRSAHVGATGTGGQAVQPGSLMGGVPVGGSGGAAGNSWKGYRRPLEPFPTSHRHVVQPVIGLVSSEPEAIEVATDYVDDWGNRITIRRPSE